MNVSERFSEKRRYPVETRFHIKERAWSLPEPFIVSDDAGSAVFEVRGAFSTIDDDLVLIDPAAGQEVARAHIREHPLLLTLHYEIYRGGRLWASMLDRFRPFHEDFKIEAGDGSALHVMGDIRNWNFSLTDEAGLPLAHIGRQNSLFPGCYAIQVEQDRDVIAIVALVIVIDMVREQKAQTTS